MQQKKGWIPTPPSAMRPVRSEKWLHRTFYVSACRFFLDVPLDMTGCILAAMREAAGSGHVAVPSGVVLATDAVLRGAVLVEIEDATQGDQRVLRVHEAELLVRDLPERNVPLRPEVDELLRWSTEVGIEASAIYVQYVFPAASTNVRATRIFATLKGESGISDSG